MDDKHAEVFEEHRPELFRLAYGMLGRVAPAKDAVQEAFLRWQKMNVNEIRSPRAYLSEIVNNICLDELKSAKNQREEYIGPNLPEPVLTVGSESPLAEVELAESLSMAMLVVLEQLTPVQRAVFLLREVFDYDYTAIADIVHKSESHCRKIAQRARDRIKKKRPSFEKRRKDQHQLVSAFVEAVKEKDISRIESMLAKEAVLYSDGGGKVAAARKPVEGAEKIARFLVGIQKLVTQNIRLELTDVNGEPGMIIYLDGRLYNIWSFYAYERKIRNIYVVLNPDKLRHLKTRI